MLHNGFNVNTVSGQEAYKYLDFLMPFLFTEYEEKPTISEERLEALCTLTYSENSDLQRSAALCLAEISERCK